MNDNTHSEAIDWSPEEIRHLGGRTAYDMLPEEPPFVGMTHDEVLDIELPRERYLVADVVPMGVTGTIAAVPEGYKTWLAMQIAFNVAKGEGNIFGRPVESGGPVGYFWSDDSTREETERVKVYERVNQARGSSLRWFLNEELRLPDDIGRLVATVQTYGFVLITLDSFYNFVPGIDLKDDEAERIVALLKHEICDRTGCTVLIVDHMPWATDTNRQRLRAYGGVFKNAATRFGIYLDVSGNNLSVEVRGNNIKGFPKTPAYWDADALEVRLIEKASADERAAGLAEARDWIADHVAANYDETGASTTKSAAIAAYVAAHDDRGRNIARQAIDTELAAATRALEDPDFKSGGGTPPRLATTTGQSRHGVYLIPFVHALPPLAATPASGTGGTSLEPIANAAPATPAAAFIKGAGGGTAAGLAEGADEFGWIKP